MYDATSLIRSNIAQMDAYQPIFPFEVLSERLGIKPEDIVKLDANENPYGPDPEVLNALSCMTATHIYPDPESTYLRQALSTHTGIPFENLLAGAGADELIDLIIRLFLDPGDVVLNCPPTFGMYAFDADIQDAVVVSVPRNADFSLDLPSIETKILETNPKLLFICSPNNPDGGVISKSALETLLKHPIMIVLDEAYIEFAPEGSSHMREVLQHTNLIVLRTFSKWAGLAGLRVGYGAFPNTLMPYLWKIKQPYNVSVAGTVAALTSLKNISARNEIGYKLIAERERLFEFLSRVSFLEPYPSKANFILCRVVGRDAGELKDTLSKAGILVRFFNKPGLQDHIRISVGRPEHTDALLAALADLEQEDA
jgi:histidinol-phosphate aminotransferase